MTLRQLKKKRKKFMEDDLEVFDILENGFPRRRYNRKNYYEELHLLSSTGKPISKSTDSTATERFTKLDDTTKEQQRPPIYNPEDYAYWIKKWGKKSVHGIVSLYSNSSMSDLESNISQRSTFRDYRNPMLSSSGMEMTLRQFGTVSELLSKLKCDLRLAYPRSYEIMKVLQEQSRTREHFSTLERLLAGQ